MTATWNVTADKALGIIGTLTPETVLYYYDGPLTFTTRISREMYLAHKVDEFSVEPRLPIKDLFFMVKTEERVISALIGGRLSLRGALSKASYWLVGTDANGEIVEAEETQNQENQELLNKYLPPLGLGLYPGFPDLPDVLPDSPNL
jgi:hypothetical protein